MSTSTETVEPVAPKQPGALKSFIAGGVGGVCLVVVGHPLDTIKVRIQTQVIEPGKPPMYANMIDCAKKSMKAEGTFALYKGMMAPLAGVTPMYALCFLGYGFGKDIFCDADAYSELKLGQIAAAGVLLNISVYIQSMFSLCSVYVQCKGFAILTWSSSVWADVFLNI